MYMVEEKDEGVTPLLYNWRNPEIFLENEMEKLKQGKVKKVKDAQYYEKLKNEWRRTVHFDEKVGLFIPGDYIEANTERAGAKVTVGRGTMKNIVKGNVVIAPEFVKATLHHDKKRVVKSLDDIEKLGMVDTRIGSIQGTPVLRRRVMVNTPWSIVFRIMVLDETYITVDQLKDLRKIGGTIGYGDYRPKYGTFKVSKFEVVEE